jgi:hypothetical protein
MNTASANTRALELLRFTEAHQRHTDALARATGDRFNVFQILRIGHLEVKTHSPMLAELLNPKGTHDQGAVFLRLFLSRFGISPFDADASTVRQEYYAGPVTEKSGGRLDIVIRDGRGAMILIENKIYAGDEDNQMTRYREFNEGARLFYLTLDGRDPSNLSEEKLKSFECISYATDIMAWLYDCRKEAVSLPRVRESITQYIHLIEDLTDQSTTMRMNHELIAEILRNKESLQAFYTLKQAEMSVQDCLISSFTAKLPALAKSVGLEVRPAKPPWGQRGGGFAFGSAGLTRQHLEILFEFEKSGFRDFFFGFAVVDGKPDELTVARLKTEFAQHFEMGNALTENVPVWAWSPNRNWSHEEFEALRNDQFADDLQEKLKMLAGIARQVCPDKEASQNQ